MRGAAADNTIGSDAIIGKEYWQSLIPAIAMTFHAVWQAVCGAA